MSADVERELLPVERMVLTIVRAQTERGQPVPPNTAAVLVMTIERLTGERDDVLFLLQQSVLDAQDRA